MLISIAPTNENSTFTPVDVKSLAEMGKLLCEKSFSAGVFKDNRRTIENFIAASCIGLDVDNDGKREDTPSMSIDDAVNLFKDHKHLILTSRSHRKEKHGKIEDRYRVILFFDKPITEAQDFYATWFALKDFFPPCDNQCKDPSRQFFAHSSVYSVNRHGKLITHVKHVNEPIKQKEARPTQPGERGELSRETLKVLQFGVEEGSRNATVYKVAKDFQQNLYELEEAQDMIVSALELNGVISSTFTESEAKSAISSAYKSEAHEPRLPAIEERNFKFITVGELYEAPEAEEHWLVQDLLLSGGTSVIAGAAKAGKTTIVRQLEYCIVRGQTFLGRKVTQGPVMHMSFDEKSKTVKRGYRSLGVEATDPIFLHFGSIVNNDYMKHFREDILRIKPVLVVIDTMFDLVQVEEINNYQSVKRAFGPFNDLAQQTGTHIMFIHHQTKPNVNYSAGSGHSVLGSTAIAAALDSVLVFEKIKNSKKRKLFAEGRGVEDFDEHELRYDKNNQFYSIHKTEIDDEF